MNISSEETILTDKLIESIIGYLMEGVHSGKRYRVKRKMFENNNRRNLTKIFPKPTLIVGFFIEFLWIIKG